MRILGKDGMASAYKGNNGGFAGPDVLKARKMYKELCALDPFQEGFQKTTTREAVGFFHDQKAGFHLQAHITEKFSWHHLANIAAATRLRSER